MVPFVTHTMSSSQAGVLDSNTLSIYSWNTVGISDSPLKPFLNRYCSVKSPRILRIQIVSRLPWMVLFVRMPSLLMNLSRTVLSLMVAANFYGLISSGVILLNSDLLLISTSLFQYSSSVSFSTCFMLKN